MSTTSTYRVEGMTCDHCGTAVREEVEQVAGVESADVDLGSATLTVRGEDVADEAVRAAVHEAGYEVAG